MRWFSVAEKGFSCNHIGRKVKLHTILSRKTKRLTPNKEMDANLPALKFEHSSSNFQEGICHPIAKITFSIWENESLDSPRFER